MDSLQRQISALTAKVDGLHEVIEQLSNQLTLTLTEIKASPASSAEVKQSAGQLMSYSYQRFGGLDAMMEPHKDVISDHSYPTSEEPTGEQDLAPEIQIRRLTAQLTAAYNRIAALEEQLLAQRVL